MMKAIKAILFYKTIRICHSKIKIYVSTGEKRHAEFSGAG
jgi:hypothetical protein